LDGDRFSLLKKRQKDVRINSIFSQMTDVDASGVNLRGIVPEDVTIPRVARRGSRVCLIQEQA
jgi:hypothetical protein